MNFELETSKLPDTTKLFLYSYYELIS